MGVLMSRKQQVEKVQRCSVVVSAFKDGLKDRPSVAPPSDEAVETEDTPPEPAAPPQEEEEEEPQKEDDDKPCASTSQQASAQQREDCRINQEAWSRLRDGKGVEPEDLDRANQLTPPAFVRPKRDINDDQPLDIELGQKEQVGWMGCGSAEMYWRDHGGPMPCCHYGESSTYQCKVHETTLKIPLSVKLQRDTFMSKLTSTGLLESDAKFLTNI